MTQINVQAKKPKYDPAYSSYSYLVEGEDYASVPLDVEVGRLAPYDLELSPAQVERAVRLVNESIVISTHEHPVVMPKDQEHFVDYWRSGHLKTAFHGLSMSGMDAVFDGFTAVLNSWRWEQIIFDVATRLSDIAHQDFVIRAERVDDILRAHETGRVALVPALEAATTIDDQLDRLDVLYGLGIRVIGIAYDRANLLGCGMIEERDSGLTRFGRQAVKRMNQLGMTIDVAHSAYQTALDTIEASSTPVIISHAGARAVWDIPRLFPDEVIVACAENGGIISIESAPNTTISPKHPGHTIDSVMDHFEYCANLVGIDHVGFGFDSIFGDHIGIHLAFRGVLAVNEFTKVPTENLRLVDHTAGLENPAETFPNVVGWLVKHEYSDGDIKKVIGGNVLRVLRESWWR